MGRKIKITENKLKQIISESVKRILKEGSNLGEDYDNWERVKECLGCEGMLSAETPHKVGYCEVLEARLWDAMTQKQER